MLPTRWTTACGIRPQRYSRSISATPLANYKQLFPIISASSACDQFSTYAGREPPPLPTQEVALKQCWRVLITQHELHPTQSGGTQRRVERVLGPCTCTRARLHELGRSRCSRSGPALPG